MSRGTRFQAERIRYLAGGDIDADFLPLNMTGAIMDPDTPQMLHPIRQFIIQNDTDGDVLISFDGIEPHIRLPAQSVFTSDVMANKASAPDGYFLPMGSIIYVSRGLDGDNNPTTGYCTFSCFYAPGDN